MNEVAVKLKYDYEPYFKAGEIVQVDEESLFDEETSFVTTFDGTAYIPKELLECDVMEKPKVLRKKPTVAGKQASKNVVVEKKTVIAQTQTGPQVVTKQVVTTADVPVQTTKPVIVEEGKKTFDTGWLSIIATAAISLAILI